MYIHLNEKPVEINEGDRFIMAQTLTLPLSPDVPEGILNATKAYLQALYGMESYWAHCTCQRGTFDSPFYHGKFCHSKENC